MLTRGAYVRVLIALAFVTLFTTSVCGQSPSTKPGALDKEVVTTAPRSGDLEKEVTALKAENAAVREQLRRMEEQQKAMLEQFKLLQQRLEGSTIADALPAKPPGTAPGADNPSPVGPETSASSPPVSSAQAKPKDDDHYQDGITIWKNSDEAKVPFLLRFNVNTQVRYLNTLNSKDTFTDHLGVVRDVHRRNDITVNRTMFILGGYMFSKKLQYS
ncbi:MAG TPA: hypothetical protein VNG71_23090, partial [Pyrinomonadaceae bacterium]|nr:hypothetical protein [Pyrinomonadaceae bacterium]